MVPLLILYAVVAIVVFVTARWRYGTLIGPALTAALVCAGGMALLTLAVAMVGTIH